MKADFKLPVNPQDAYKDKWKGWDTFLGLLNPTKRKEVRFTKMVGNSTQRGA